MNEATLEARLGSELTKLFPSLNQIDLTHQKSFTLKLGHNHILVNGCQKAIAGGRLDILLSYRGKPLAVVELKGPNVILDSDDIEQGVSYARLLNPMPPLVIISNGNETQFYRSFDMAPWTPEDINEVTVQSLFKTGISCAESDHDHAIKTLLGHQPDLWEKIIKDYTKKELKEIEGNIDDFAFPIATDFQVERSIIGDILDCIKKNPLVNLIGTPLSGKTSVVYQLCHQCPSNVVPLYIDSNNNYGILQKISNQLSHSLFKKMTPDDVRHWLINSFRDANQNRLIIIIDNFVSFDDPNIGKEIFELLDINENSAFSILLIMNEFVLNNLSSPFGRPTKNILGKAPVIKLSALSDEEFEKALLLLSNNFGIFFHHGAKYNVEYRNPRLLRVIIADLAKHKLLVKPLDNKITVLPSITTFNLLSGIWNNMVTDMDLQTDLRDLVEIIIKEKDIRNDDPLLSILSFGRGTVTSKSAELLLGEKRIERLKRHGFIQRFNLNGGKSYIVPKFPEALSAAASFYLEEKLANKYLNSNQSELYDFFIQTAPLFPYGDLVAAKAIFEASKMNPDILSGFVNRLLKDAPKIVKTPNKGKYSTYFEDVGQINISGQLDGMLISNFYPWLILSHIASVPIGDDNGDRSFQLSVLYKVGSFNNILLRVDNIPLQEMKGYHVHEKEDTSLLCGKVGIIEPITYAMQCGFYSMPEGMVELSKYAIKHGNESLLMRLNIAAKSTTTCCNKITSKCSREVEKLISGIIAKEMGSDKNHMPPIS